MDLVQVTMFRPGQSLLMCMVAATSAPAAAASALFDSPPVAIHIQPGPLDRALSEWAQVTHLHYFKNGTAGRGAVSAGLDGSYTPGEALEALLANTGLTYIVINDSTVRIRLAPTARKRNTAIDAPKVTDLEEVVVTGSHIPGISTASPLRVYTREEIDRTGAATAEEFVAILTQNYGTGPSEYGYLRTLGTSPVQLNPSFGTGANLRGLGASSTLILVNGHRLAPSGYDDFVDVSMIPFGAIERVEVLTDGASAIYGSDAVGGVVNFILRDRYAAPESALRTGTSTHGDARSCDAFQAVGAGWESGYASLSLQLQGRGSINNQDRDFSRGDAGDLLYGPRDLVPRMLRDSFVGALEQALPYGIDISTQGFYTRRRTIYHGCNAPCSGAFTDRLYDQHVSNAEYEAALTLSFMTGPRWKFEVTADASRNWVNSEPIFQPATSAPTTTGADLWSLGASSTGVLYALPAGDLEFSWGASHRSQAFRLANALGTFRSQSEIEASYLELRIPLGNPDLTLSDNARLLLTLAGRYEHYSTFGSTFNPKVSLQVAATPGLSLRGGYSSAFKAPNANQLRELDAGRFLQSLPNGTAMPGQTLTLIRYGGNPNLRDQSADVWTVGLDWESPAPGLRSTLSYFSVDYKHIIWDPSTVPSAGIFTNPAYSDYILRRSPANDSAFNSLAQTLIGDSRLVGCTPPSYGACTEPVTDIGAIVDQRQANLASVQTSGIEWNAQRTTLLPVGKLNTQIESTYIIDYRERVTPAADAVEIANTAGNPPKIHLRAALQWEYGNWSTGTAANFTNSYSTRGSLDAAGNPLPLATVAAWTTFDLQLAYTPPGLRIALDIINVLDKQPPHVEDLAYGLGYDPANANPFGRLISLQLRKLW